MSTDSDQLTAALGAQTMQALMDLFIGGTVDVTARAAAATNTASIATNTAAIAALPGLFASAQGSSQRALVPAGPDAAVPTSTSGIPASGYSIRAYKQAAIAVTDIRVRLANWSWDSNGDHTSANPISMKVALEYNGVTYPLTFNGARTVAMALWSTIDSDPLGIEFAAGDVYYVRCYMSGTSGDVWPASSNINGDVVYGQALAGSYATTDVCDSTGAMTTTAATVRVPLLAGVYGRPVTGSVPRVLLGLFDSLGAGQGDTYQGVVLAPGESVSGFFIRGLGANRIAVTTGASAVQAVNVAAKTGHLRIGRYWGDCTDALVLLGTNDIGSAAATLAQCQAYLTTIWTDLANRGLKVYGCTLPPRTSSTDSWATTANQTALATESIRVALDTWIRSKPAPLTDYFDLADQCETARNSGIWIAGGTPDGVHPGLSTATAGGAALNTWLTARGL